MIQTMIRPNRLAAALLLLIGSALMSCTRMETFPSPGAKGHTSLFFSTVGGGTSAGSLTKTSVNPDGRSVEWNEGDRLSLWARSSDGAWVLENQEFSLYAKDGSRAWFSTTVSSPMPEGSYTYFCAYPRPLAVNGNEAVFSLPSRQDGLASSGADIMTATVTDAARLSEIPNPENHSTLSMTFSHLVHLLRFYIPEGNDMFGGEKLRKLVISMPRAVAGKVTVDITDPAGTAALAEGENTITLDLSRPIGESLSERDYAYAAVFPASFAEGESMIVKAYTATKVAVAAPISLKSRNMQAGHATSVPLVPQSVSPYFRIKLHVDSNHLGEDARSITLTAPEGCRWSDTGANVLVYEPGRDITAGEAFELEFEDESAYRSLSGASVTATYDSEHISISETFSMPDMSSGYGADVSLNIPYLLYEDFSGVSGFKSNDEYATSSAGSKSPVSFLSGWTGARAGAEAGKCIRIACRRETSADYHARVESAPLRGIIKKPVDLSVSFDYGADNRYGGLAIITDGNVGQNVYVGYVTNTKGYSSGDTAGTFENGNGFYVKEYSGSYSSTPNDWTAIIHSAPAGAVFRVSWRTEIEHQAGTTNTTAWLYIDNVKVQVNR